MKLTACELREVQGGGIKFWAIVGGVGVFLAGLFDGITRPLKCR